MGVSELGEVLYITLQNNVQQIHKRILASDHKLSYEEVNAVSYPEIMTTIEQKWKNIYVEECIRITPDALEEYIHSCIAARPEIKFVAIDSIHQIQLNPANPTSEFNDLNLRLKALARKLDIVLVLVAQVNTKKINERIDTSPKFGDIRGCSSIEDNADILLSLYRRKAAQKGEVDIRVLKGRGIANAEFSLRLKEGYFVELSSERKDEIVKEKEFESDNLNGPRVTSEAGRKFRDMFAKNNPSSKK